MPLSETFGAADFPIELGDVSADIAYPDVANAALLGFFEAVIAAELAATWATVANRVGSLAGTSPVEDRFDMAPTVEVLTQRKTAFPALFVFRDGKAEEGEYAEGIPQATQRWGVHYILGQLPVGEAEKVLKLLDLYLPRLLSSVVRTGKHDAYNSGNQAITSSSAGAANLHSLKVIDAQGGQISDPTGKSTGYWAMAMVLESVELWEEKTAALANHDGFTAKLLFDTEHDGEITLIEAQTENLPEDPPL